MLCIQQSGCKLFRDKQAAAVAAATGGLSPVHARSLDGFGCRRPSQEPDGTEGVQVK